MKKIVTGLLGLVLVGGLVFGAVYARGGVVGCRRVFFNYGGSSVTEDYNGDGRVNILDCVVGPGLGGSDVVVSSGGEDKNLFSGAVNIGVSGVGSKTIAWAMKGNAGSYSVVQRTANGGGFGVEQTAYPPGHVVPGLAMGVSQKADCAVFEEDPGGSYSFIQVRQSDGLGVGSWRIPWRQYFEIKQVAIDESCNFVAVLAYDSTPGDEHYRAFVGDLASDPLQFNIFDDGHVSEAVGYEGQLSISAFSGVPYFSLTRGPSGSPPGRVFKCHNWTVNGGCDYWTPIDIYTANYLNGGEVSFDGTHLVAARTTGSSLVVEFLNGARRYYVYDSGQLPGVPQKVANYGQQVMVSTDGGIYLSRCDPDSGCTLWEGPVAFQDNTLVSGGASQLAIAAIGSEVFQGLARYEDSHVAAFVIGGCASPSCRIEVNSATGQSCDQICPQRLGDNYVCANIGTDGQGTNSRYWSYVNQSCGAYSTFNQDCQVAMNDQGQTCEGRLAKWTNCRCETSLLCNPISPSTTPLAITNGLTASRPYEDYTRTMIWLYGKQNDDATLALSSDVSFCFQLDEKDCVSVAESRPYLLIIITYQNRQGTEPGGSWPAGFFRLETNGQEIPVTIPAFSFPSDAGQWRYYWYVASDGSVYHARSDHAAVNVLDPNNTQGIDLSPSQAFRSQHLASSCRDSVPAPPSIGPDAQFSCSTGTAGDPGDPAYINLKLMANSVPLANHTSYLLVGSTDSQLAPAWCTFATNGSGEAVINNLYHLWGDNQYQLFPFYREGNRLYAWEAGEEPVTAASVPLSHTTMPDRVILSATRSTPVDLGSQPVPPSGTANLSGEAKVFMNGVPTEIENIPVYIYNVDTDQIYTTSTDANGHYELDNIPAGRYLLIYRFWDRDESLYTAQEYRTLLPGDNIKDALMM